MDKKESEPMSEIIGEIDVEKIAKLIQNILQEREQNMEVTVTIVDETA